MNYQKYNCYAEDTARYDDGNAEFAPERIAVRLALVLRNGILLSVNKSGKAIYPLNISLCNTVKTLHSTLLVGYGVSEISIFNKLGKQLASALSKSHLYKTV